MTSVDAGADRTGTGDSGGATRAVLLIGDLMMGSRARDTLSKRGIRADSAASFEALEQLLAPPPALLVVDVNDLRLRPLEAIARARVLGVTVLAYGSHVDGATLLHAREAGADHVVPRSMFSARLEALSDDLVRGADARR